MYYTNTPQPNMNAQQPNGQVQDWSRQSGRDQAGQAASRQLPGSQTLDVQDEGTQYKVHVRDRDGRYKTMYMDRNFNQTRTVDGYC